MKIGILFVLSAVLWSGKTSFAQVTMESDINLLFSESAPVGQLHAYGMKLADTRVKLVVTLTRAMERAVDERKAASLAYVLGEYRAAEAIPVLIKRITLRLPDPLNSAGNEAPEDRVRIPERAQHRLHQ